MLRTAKKKKFTRTCTLKTSRIKQDVCALNTSSAAHHSVQVTCNPYHSVFYSTIDMLYLDLLGKNLLAERTS